MKVAPVVVAPVLGDESPKAPRGAVLWDPVARAHAIRGAERWERLEPGLYRAKVRAHGDRKFRPAGRVRVRENRVTGWPENAAEVLLVPMLTNRQKMKGASLEEQEDAIRRRLEASAKATKGAEAAERRALNPIAARALEAETAELRRSSNRRRNVLGVLAAAAALASTPFRRRRQAR